MVRKKKSRKELFSFLDLPRIGEREPITDMFVMAVEFMKYQGEVAYESSKTQALAIASTVSTIGVGWSAFFYGIVQEAWLTAGLGIIMANASTFVLAYWTPRLVDNLRENLDNLGATKFYNKWLADSAKSGPAEKSP